MKVRATFQIVFNASREVEIDEDDFQQWAGRRYGERYDRDLAMAAWIEAQDTEFVANVFGDWRTDSPLPRDFELQYVEAADVQSTPDPDDAGA